MIKNITIIEQTDTTAAMIMLRSDGIMHFDLKPSRTLTIDDIKEITTSVGEIGGNNKFANLITVGNYITVAPGVREYAAAEEANRFSLCDAFVLTSLAEKMIVNFYINFNKPLVPTRMFNKIEPAVDWLYKKRNAVLLKK